MRLDAHSVDRRDKAGTKEHPNDSQRSAQWLTETLHATGFPTGEAWPSGAVWAEWCPDPKAPTVLVCSHQDVRTAGPEPWNRCAPTAPLSRRIRPRTTISR